MFMNQYEMGDDHEPIRVCAVNVWSTCRRNNTHKHQPTRKLAPSYMWDTRFASGLMLSSGMLSNSAAVKNPCDMVFNSIIIINQF